MINFYGKIGDVNNAVNTFNNVAENKKNIVSINAMMTCFIDSNQNEKAISIYKQYNGIHDDLSNTLLMTTNNNIGDVNNEVNIFNNIAENSRNIVTIRIIGAMMKCFIDNNHDEKAISLYEQYNGEDNDVSDLLFIKACTNIGDADEGQKLIKSTSNDSIEFMDSVINVYGKVGYVNNAMNTFKNIAENKKDT